jgi:hypothetical protein
MCVSVTRPILGELFSVKTISPLLPHANSTPPGTWATG